MSLAFSNASCNANLSGTYFSREQFRQIVVIGDVHGDFTALIKCLKIARLVRRVGKSWTWVGSRRTAVVLLGDTVDRFRRSARPRMKEFRSHEGPMRTGGERQFEELRTVLLLNSLSEQAETAGSAVLSLIHI